MMKMVPVEEGYQLRCFIDDYLWPWEGSTPVLMHHGYARNATFWNNWVPLLASRHRIYRPEVRGCGGSTVPPEGYVFEGERLVKDIRAVLNYFDLDQVHWIGESSGGVVGLFFALHFPERLKSLVLCNTPALLSDELNDAYSVDQSSTVEAIRELGVKEWCLETIHYRLDAEIHPPPSSMITWYADEMGKTPLHVATGLMECFQGVDLSGELSSIEVPTLLLSGDQSEIAAEQQQLLAETMPEARLTLFEGYGHGINLLNPEGCVEEVRTFYDSL